MKTRILVAFTVDVDEKTLKEICRTAFMEFGGDDMKETHVVARRGGETIVEIGSSPKEKP